MIHDLLMACLNLKSGTLALEVILESGAIEELFHPCEKEILLGIIEFINCYRYAARFAKTYGVYESRKSLYSSEKISEGKFLKEGIYLRALCTGVEDLMNIYYKAIAELEERFLKNPTYSIMMIYQKLHEYEYIAYISNKLLRGIETREYHGCTLLQFVQRCSDHGDPKVAEAVQMCLKPIINVFLRQLTNWILYAKIGDPYREFFIQAITKDDSLSESSEHALSNCSGPVSDTSAMNDKNLSCSSNKMSETMSEGSEDFDSIWHYEIQYELIPKFLTTEYAEKVFFIGQTVLIFKVDAINSGKENSTFVEDTEANGGEFYLWKDKELYFFEKIQGLIKNEIRAHAYEAVIDEIKDFVTRRLLEIAVNKADLVRQLNLIKDFYLLGRGELFLEFIRLVHQIDREDDNETKLAQFIKSFEQAAGSVGVTDELDQFVLRVIETSTELDVTTEFGFLQQICFDYKINWPLHLLFSPKVLERYNILFRFLLLIKKLQCDLHAVWIAQNVSAKRKVSINNKVVRLRNNLMFFVDNLQYYIQADVLESQFSILKATIAGKTDFEQIQKAHSVFQANILSLCFLLMDEEPENISVSRAPTLMNSANPVYVIIIELCHIVEEFCYEVQKGQFTDEHERVKILNDRFNVLITDLTDVFLQFKATSCATPLSQFLLRLDFNRWFSGSKHKQNGDSDKFQIDDDLSD